MWYCRVRAGPGGGGVHLVRFSPGVPVTATASADLTLEEQTGEGDTPLTLAAAAGLVDNVRTLLGHGASPHNTNGRNESPLLIGTNNIMLNEQLPGSRGPRGEHPHPQIPEKYPRTTCTHSPLKSCPYANLSHPVCTQGISAWLKGPR